MMFGVPVPELPAAMVRQDAYRPADWRWQRAVHWSMRTDRCGWKREDFWTREAAVALRERPRWFRPSKALAERLQRVKAAQQIHSTHHARIALQNAWILAEVAVDEIADRLGQSVEAVQWYERLFFDVRNRLECETAMVFSVLGHQPSAGRKRIAWAMQSLAYYGGPVALDAAAPLLLSKLRGHSADDVVVPATMRDLVDTLLDDLDIPFTAEHWMAVRPLLRSTAFPTAGSRDWNSAMSDQLADGLAQEAEKIHSEGRSRTA